MTSSTFSSLPFAVLFFSAMVGHELALEALATHYQRFEHMATSVTLFQFGFCVFFPLTLSVGGGGDVIRNFPSTFRELWVYIKLSAVVYGATAFATSSLRYEGVTYVTKVVFKSSKLIPTMIVGVIMDAIAERSGKVVKKRSYGVWEYLSALLLCLGAAGFCMTPKDLGFEEDGSTAEEASEGFTKGSVNLGHHWMGIALLATSVFCDALVPNLQQNLMNGTGGGANQNQQPSHIRKESDDNDDVEMVSLVDGNGEKQGSPSKRQPQNAVGGGISSKALMVNTNSIGFTLLLVSTIFRSTFFPILSFICAHPHFLALHVTVGMGLGTAVLAYMEIIRRSGPAIAVAVATLRKVVTVVLSYVIFPKPLTYIHAISGGLVMSGILMGMKKRRD